MREKDKERQRNTDVREKYQSIDCLLLVCIPPGTEPATQACILTRNQASSISLCGTMPNQLSHTGQGRKSIILIEFRNKSTG